MRPAAARLEGGLKLVSVQERQTPRRARPATTLCFACVQGDEGDGDLAGPQRDKGTVYH